MVNSAEIVSGALTATGTIGPYRPGGGLRPFNTFITGTFVATVELQRSYDGVTYTTVASPDLSAVASFTGPATFTLLEPDPAALYQLNVTDYTSGTITGRMG